MPRTPPDQIFVDINFPMAGIDLALAFDEQRSAPMVDGRSAKTTVLGINVRAYEPLTGRGRGGSRPGLSRYIAQQVPQTPPLMFNGYPGKIQHLNYIVDPRAEALPFGDYEPFPGLNPTGVIDISTPSITINGTVVLRNGLDSDTLDFGVGSSPPRYVEDGGSAIQPNRLLRRRKQLTPIITWADPADIAVGQALSSTQLNAAAFDPLTILPLGGSFAYKPVSGTVLRAGNNQPLTAKFTPSDTARYNSPSDTVHINVNKQQVFIDWSNPSDITVGTALSATQLNATASDSAMITVNGAFVYTPPSGTVLSAGNAQALQTVFTPSDTTTYGSATATVSINVASTAITFVQGRATSRGTAGSPGTVHMISYSSNVSSGNLLIVGVFTYRSGFIGSPPGLHTTVTVTDSRGNAYTQLGGYVTLGASLNNNNDLSFWYCKSGSSGANTLTITAADSCSLIAAEIAEYSNIASASYLDGSATHSVNGGITTSWTTGSVSITQSTDLLLGIFAANTASDTMTPAAGMNSRISHTQDAFGGDLYLLDKIPQASSGSVSGTTTNQNLYFAIGASFKKA